MAKERIRISQTDQETLIEIRSNLIVAGFTLILGLLFIYIYLMMWAYMPVWGRLLATPFLLLWCYLTALLVINKRTITINSSTISRERGPLPSWQSRLELPTSTVEEVSLNHQLINVNANQKASSYFILLKVTGVEKPQLLDHFSSERQAQEILELIELQRKNTQ